MATNPILPANQQPTVDDVAMFRDWLADEDAVWGRYSEGRRGEEAEIERQWASVINPLHVWWLRVQGVSQGFHHENEEDAAHEDDVRFDALFHLQERALRVVSEVLALLRTGHAEGAVARWRTLHEIATTMTFLARHDQDLANRYLQHPTARAVKDLSRYERSADRLGLPSVSDATRVELEEAALELEVKYGANYGRSSYGWASHHLQNQRPSFADIERAVGAEHSRLVYGEASESVHAGPAVLSRSPSKVPLAEEVVSGPSAHGLDTCLPDLVDAVLTCTRAFVGCRPNSGANRSLVPLTLLASDILSRGPASRET